MEVVVVVEDALSVAIVVVATACGVHAHGSRRRGFLGREGMGERTLGWRLQADVMDGRRGLWASGYNCNERGRVGNGVGVQGKWGESVKCVRD